MRKNATRILFGLVLVGAAVLLFGNSIGWWDVKNFSGWWTVFLIVPGIAGIISYGFSIWNCCLVLVGVWFLACKQGWMPPEIQQNMIWIVILLIAGLGLIFGSFRKKKVHEDTVVFDDIKGAHDANSTANYSAVFGGVEVANNSQSFCGGSVNAVFGSATLDLRRCTPVDGAVLEAHAVFGGIEIFVPGNCRLRVEGVPVFGGMDNRAMNPEDPSLPLLMVKYVSVFGGVEIR